MAEILKVDENISEEAVLTRAAEILAAGGVIAYPTETFYGIGADATNEQAVRRIFAIKGRDFNTPISLIIGSSKDVYQLVDNINDNARKLMTAFWPGPLTIIFNASGKILPVLTAQTGKIGIRVSSHKGAMVIAQKSGQPLTATSANLSGAPECSTAADVNAQIGSKLDAIIDLGKTVGGKGSTVIDITTCPPQILRAGAISRSTLCKYIYFQ